MSLVGSGGTTQQHMLKKSAFRRGKREQWERFQQGCHGFSEEGGWGVGGGVRAESSLAYLASVKIPMNI